MIALKFLLVRLGLLLLLYSVSRVLFLAFNFDSFRNLPAGDILGAFVVGLRFDVAAICVTNSVFILLSLLPGPFQQSPKYQRFLKYFFAVTNVPFLLVNVIDVEYFKFVGQRSTLSVLDMTADVPTQAGQLALHYWHIIVLAGALIFPLFYFQPKLEAPLTAEWRRQGWRAWARDFAILLAVLPLSVYGGRGGWQQKALSPAHAHVFDASILAHLALNSSYTFMRSGRSCDAGALTRVRYFETDDELKRELIGDRPPSGSKSSSRDNVVIIIVESLSLEYMGAGNSNRGYTPFLDLLARKGVFFKNNFAGARRSIDSILPILAGLPYLSNSTFTCALTKDIHGLGSVLKERGYETSFFHGGHNGTMFFDVLSKRMGFDRYYGLSEYPNPEDYDGIWGVYDEPFLQFAAQELTRSKEPFASVIFTLSSHNPYKIPAQYHGVFPNGGLPIHEAIGYADHALKRFFEAAEKTSWYKNTLFVLTGDHTERTGRAFRNLIDTYRVPLVLFHPGRKLPNADPSRITQHMDIAPSVIDLLGISTNKKLPFGHSVFDSTDDAVAVSQVDGTYWLAHKNYYLEYRLDSPSKLFDAASDSMLASPVNDKPDVKQRLEKKLKAYIQAFNDGLVENKLYP
jgi:phosphoglycerol transferase MdoB-like AlkP superfamily enzyme